MTQTVLVTGATGYIAKHLVLQLLDAGYNVVGSARNLEREAEMHEALRPRLRNPANLANLKIVALDLSADAGWDGAMEDVDILMHTASPFPLTQPKNEEETIRPAVDGALRALKAAHKAGIKRVIMTSSSIAISTSDLPAGQSEFDETNWSDINHPGATAYAKSKTLAERAVWDWATENAPEMQVTMINPTFVQGAPLDQNYGTSVKVIRRMLKGSDPMLPDLTFPCVDVRDIAAMHIAALENPASAGQRYIGSDRLIHFAEIAALLKSDHPGRKIPTRVAPNFLIRLLALFDPTIRTILPSLGRADAVSNAKARRDLGITFRDARQSVRETGQYLVDNTLV